MFHGSVSGSEDGSGMSFSFPESYSVDSLTQEYESDGQNKYIKILMDVSEPIKREIIELIELKRTFPLNLKISMEDYEPYFYHEEGFPNQRMIPLEDGQIKAKYAEHEPMIKIENAEGFIQYLYSVEDVNKVIKELETIRDEVWPN